MNILLIKHFFVGCIVSEIPRVSVFGYFPYSVTFPYFTWSILNNNLNFKEYIRKIQLKLSHVIYIVESNRIRIVPEYGYS